MTRVWARYVRVSRLGGREGEAFMSPAIQQDSIAGMIRRTGGRAGPVFEDIDRSGRTFERAGIQSALAWVMQDPSTRGLATYDASRLGRNVSESLAVVKRLREAGAAYGSASESVDDTPEGVLALTMWLAFAEHYSAKVSQTWRAVHESRAGRGLHHGTPPLGYRLEGRRAVVDEETAGVVREVFERYARGETLKRVAARLGEARGCHVPTQNAKRTLGNRFYVGEVRFRGEWLPGKQERIVDDVLWKRVELRLCAEAGQQASRAEPASFLLGVLKCDGCGGGVSVVNRGLGLSCTQFRKRYPEDRTCEGFGAPRIERVQDLVVVTLIEAGRVALRHQDVTPAPSRVAGLEAEAKTLRAGRSRLAAALARGAMSDSAFDLAMKELETDLASVEERLSEARRDETVAPRARVELLDTMHGLLLLPPGEARALLREAVVELRVRRTSEPGRRWDGEITPVWR